MNFLKTIVSVIKKIIPPAKTPAPTPPPPSKSPAKGASIDPSSPIGGLIVGAAALATAAGAFYYMNKDTNAFNNSKRHELGLESNKGTLEKFVEFEKDQFTTQDRAADLAQSAQSTPSLRKD